MKQFSTCNNLKLLFQENARKFYGEERWKLMGFNGCRIKEKWGTHGKKKEKQATGKRNENKKEKKEKEIRKE